MIKSIVIGAMLFLVSGVSHAEFTAVHKVGLIDTDLNAATTVTPSVAGGWGAPSCPTHFFITFDSNTPAQKELLATFLTAKAADMDVRVDGTCGNFPFFVANKVRLQ